MENSCQHCAKENVQTFKVSDKNGNGAKHLCSNCYEEITGKTPDIKKDDNAINFEDIENLSLNWTKLYQTINKINLVLITIFGGIIGAGIGDYVSSVFNDKTVLYTIIGGIIGLIIGIISTSFAMVIAEISKTLKAILQELKNNSNKQ